MSLFAHGQMDRPEYAMRVVQSHLGCLNWPDLRGRTIIELGPGDSVATALIAKALGASRVILVDVDAFASPDLAPYHSLAKLLHGEGFCPPALSGCRTLEDLLSRCDASYMTNGLSDLQSIPREVADLVFSQAVLEHIRKRNLAAFMRETFRVMKPDGVASHEVDLKDHLGGALDNLRFTEKLWEAEWMARSGFYTNRLRHQEFLELFDSVGFDYEVVKTQSFCSLPTARRKLCKHYRSWPEEDLLISAFHVLLTRHRAQV